MLRDNARNGYMKIAYHGHGYNGRTHYSNNFSWASLGVHEGIILSRDTSPKYDSSF